MDGNGKLIAGCVVLIPLIILLLLCAWKLWHGKWLRLDTGWSFAPDEGPDSPYRLRRRKRIALVNLVLAAALAGQLGLLAVEALGAEHVGGQTWPFAVLVAWCLGSCIWVLGGSRRDARAIAAGSDISAGYTFGTRHAVALVAVMLAVVAVETAMFLFER